MDREVITENIKYHREKKRKYGFLFSVCAVLFIIGIMSWYETRYFEIAVINIALHFSGIFFAGKFAQHMILEIEYKVKN